MPQYDRVANLILGPQLRRVTVGQAVLWLQTDAPARVTVRAGLETVTVDTFETHGVHVALPILRRQVVTTIHGRGRRRAGLAAARHAPIRDHSA